MTIQNLTEESRFTKEQLTKIIDAANEVITALAGENEDLSTSNNLGMVRAWDYLNDDAAPPEVVKRLAEIALALLTVPDDIPPHVLDAMSEMCDAGFDAQGIWDLCRGSIMPPAPCPRCGTVSGRPDGGHYCHVDAGQCGICAKCVPQINGGSGFSNCAEAHAAEIGQPCIAAIKGADANA